MKKPRFETTTIYFGKLLAKRLVQTGLVNEIDLIIPVPSHWWRRVTRRISTAEILAETVACELDLPWTKKYVWRSRYTSKQGMLKATERGANVKGAFKAKFPRRVRNRRILLVDDVLTSGATANEVTRALLEAGAQSVMVGAIARALGDQKSILVDSGTLSNP
jgi:ComF family protein